MACTAFLWASSQFTLSCCFFCHTFCKRQKRRLPSNSTALTSEKKHFTHLSILSIGSLVIPAHNSCSHSGNNSKYEDEKTPQNIRFAGFAFQVSLFA
jgi:hypothetical protein